MTTQLINGDCLEEMKKIEGNSIDAIVTDPPYELGFMGKSWDNTGIAYNVELWREAIRVLKPGGHLLSFGGSRTYHRMACAIEDAGFEIRDMIEWVYGCLSEDSEVLTQRGYRHFNKLTQYDKIAIYDVKKDIYKWERPQGWSIYKVHKDTAYRIKSDHTDQIVSRNHRCLVEREGKLVFVTAEELKEVEYMPTLSEDFYSLQEGHRKLLLKELLWKGKRLAQKLFSKWTRKEVSSERIEVRKEPSLERWSNLLEETRKLQADKICKVSEGVFTDGKKRWICNGTSFDSGSILGDMFREGTSHTSYQSRPTGQPTGKPDVISIKQGTQIIRRARVEKIEYSGIIFCPTVSTGAFIARRNGQVFITGNSGFPKSLNIGKAVDKIQGNEREVVGVSEGKGYSSIQEKNIEHNNRPYIEGLPYLKADRTLTKGTSEWEGWGTALKPAHEPICMARKPLAEKTVAENCLKWGTGGINIDESRVDFVSEEDRKESTTKNQHADFGTKPMTNNNVYGDYSMIEPKNFNPTGRFPANLIHDGSDEVEAVFPQSNGGAFPKKSNIPTGQHYDGGWGAVDNGKRTEMGSGSASRFFYCAKSSKSERNKGLEGFDKQTTDDGRKKSIDNPFLRGETVRHNNHPTVKPITLMRYLCKLVTPPGGIIIDPFLGSGTTGIAAKLEGFDFIGIERETDYYEIAKARIESA